MPFTAQKGRATCLAALLALCALTAGCTTSPTSGRPQFNILPAPIETGVSDLRFSVKTALATGDYCRDEEESCAVREAAERLAQRIAPIAERLGTVAPQLSPELVTRVPRVEVFVVPNDSLSVGSSAGGKIAVGSGLHRLELTDTDLALALAREFGRLAAAHHRESTSAGLTVSLITGSPLVGTYLATSLLADILFPMGTLLKVGISLLGSMGTEQLVEASQQEEADEFAGRLMRAAGYNLRELAVVCEDVPAGNIRIGWLPSYFTSRARVAGMAPPLDAAAVALADQELPLEAKEEAATPEERAEPAAPAPQAAQTIEPQDSPPEAKAAAANKAPQSAAKKKVRKTPRKKTRPAPSRGG